MDLPVTLHIRAGKLSLQQLRSGLPKHLSGSLAPLLFFFLLLCLLEASHSPFPRTPLSWRCARSLPMESVGKCTGAPVTTGSQSKGCLSIHPILQHVPIPCPQRWCLPLNHYVFIHGERPTLRYCDGNTTGCATEKSVTSLGKDKRSGTTELQSLNLVVNGLIVMRRKGRERTAGLEEKEEERS